MKEYKIERERTAEEQMMKLGLVTSNIGKYEEFKRTLKKPLVQNRFINGAIIKTEKLLLRVFSAQRRQR